MRFIHPGKPDRNAFIERFNKTCRDEVLDAYVFESIDQVREITDAWLREYNGGRPRDSLGRVPPLTFMPRRATVRERCTDGIDSAILGIANITPSAHRLASRVRPGQDVG